jgi:hypothetical protein
MNADGGGGGCPSGRPHFTQNRVPSTISAPQPVQNGTMMALY